MHYPFLVYSHQHTSEKHFCPLPNSPISKIQKNLPQDQTTSFSCSEPFHCQIVLQSAMVIEKEFIFPIFFAFLFEFLSHFIQHLI